MIVGVTGHRPHRTGGYSEENKQKLIKLATAHLRKLRPSKVIVGMALGWDTAIALAAVSLGIPFVAAIPFRGQESVWPQAAREEYRNLLLMAETVHYVTQGDFSAQAMELRNQWIVNNSDYLLALWDGSRYGGTFNCVEFAHYKGLEVYNLWEEYGKL